MFGSEVVVEDNIISTYAHFWLHSAALRIVKQKTRFVFDGEECEVDVDKYVVSVWCFSVFSGERTNNRLIERWIGGHSVCYAEVPRPTVGQYDGAQCA